MFEAEILLCRTRNILGTSCNVEPGYRLEVCAWLYAQGQASSEWNASETQLFRYSADLKKLLESLHADEMRVFAQVVILLRLGQSNQSLSCQLVTP